MITKLFGVSLAFGLLLGLFQAPVASAADTGNNAALAGKVVSDDPASNTPSIMDGTVLSIAQVGGTIVVGGSFTTVRNAGSAVDIARSNIFAFDPSTGQVSTSFAPNPTGAVYKVLPTADETSVYLGGDFFNLAYAGTPVAVNRLTKLKVSDGSRDATFAPGSWDGQVRDLELTGSRLWVAGKFTYAQGKKQKALATINATTGAYDPFFKSVFAGLHRSGYSYDVTDVLAISTDPVNKRLVAIGNFTSVDGTDRSQIAMFDIAGTTSALANWSTKLYESRCAAQFDTTMTDVSFSPDGSYFAVSTTGSYGGTSSLTSESGCDVVARFEADGSGTTVRPTWAAYTGGDTTWTVEVTADAIYAGGHQRWQNNPAGSNAAGQGAVERTGIAALNPENGMAYAWNPTRTRGVGVKDMLATDQGLYVGSDTTTFAHERHDRLAFLPALGGTTLPTEDPLSLPGNVVTVATGATKVVQRRFDGATAGAASTPAGFGSVLSSSVGAFMLRGTLYVAGTNGTFTKRTMAKDGSLGTASAVDAADELVRQADWHDTDVKSLTSLFYDHGRIYYTRAGQNYLYSRGFEATDDVVGQLRYSSPAVAGISWSDVRGAFVADGKLYLAGSKGALVSATWDGTAPVAGTAKTVTKAGSGWASKVMFVTQSKANVPPTSKWSASCTGLTCSFDASGASDLDGTVDSYRWDFGDGSTGSGVSTSHSYSSAGDRTATLTVTDDQGATDTSERTVSPESVTSDVSFVDSATSSGNRTAHTVTVPSTVRAKDQLVLFFTGNTTSPTYTPPAGWDQVETRAGDKMTATAWKRTATDDDAGRTVTVTSSTLVKDVMTVAAYRDGSVGAAASSLETVDSASHTTPSVDAADSHHWVVSYWTDKGSSTTAWDLPDGVRRRSTVVGSGSGHTSAVLADSDGAVGSGQQGGLRASADAAASAAVTFTLLLG